jgi:hypothetical protein
MVSNFGLPLLPNGFPSEGNGPAFGMQALMMYGNYGFSPNFSQIIKKQK